MYQAPLSKYIADQTRILLKQSISKPLTEEEREAIANVELAHEIYEDLEQKIYYFNYWSEPVKVVFILDRLRHGLTNEELLKRSWTEEQIGSLLPTYINTETAVGYKPMWQKVVKFKASLSQLYPEGDEQCNEDILSEMHQKIALRPLIIHQKNNAEQLLKDFRLQEHRYSSTTNKEDIKNIRDSITKNFKEIDLKKIRSGGKRSFRGPEFTDPKNIKETLTNPITKWVLGDTLGLCAFYNHQFDYLKSAKFLVDD